MTRADKISATKKAKASRLAAQIIEVDLNWRIVRTDPRNWEIRYRGTFHGYYGTLLAAFQALPGSMLDVEAKGTLDDVWRCQGAILDRITTALKFKLA
jgi:hypothetical protein